MASPLWMLHGCSTLKIMTKDCDFEKTTIEHIKVLLKSLTNIPLLLSLFKIYVHAKKMEQLVIVYYEIKVKVVGKSKLAITAKTLRNLP